MTDEITIAPSSTPLSQIFSQRFNEFKVGMNIAPNMFSSTERTKEKKEIIPSTLLRGMSIHDFWSKIWGNDLSLLREYHEKRTEKDIVCSKWELHPDKASGYRVMTLQTVVEVPRPGTYTLLHEAHRFAFSMSEGRPKLVYQISSQTPDVPAGTTFRCEVIMEVTADALDTDCTVIIFANTKKMSLAFSAIQFIATPRAIRELQAGYVQLMALITERLCGGPSLKGKGPAVEVAPAAAPPPPMVEYHPPEVLPIANAPPSVPSWVLVGLAVLTIFASILLLLSVWSASSSSSDLRQLVESVQAARISSVMGGGGGDGSAKGDRGIGGSPLWDLVDRELTDSGSRTVLNGNTDKNDSHGTTAAAASPGVLTKGQLSILARQEAMFDAALSVINTLQHRQDALEANHSWMWMMWVVQFIAIVVTTVKVFLFP